jgi:glycyl-tRNA synthetase beta chain
MSSRDLLFEIGTEEIPARFMPKALQDFRAYASEEFDAARVGYDSIEVCCTPRRLVLMMKGVKESQEDSVETAKGPLKTQAYDEDGKPTRAAEGFARSKGVPVESLAVKKIGNSEFVIAEIRRSGGASADIIPGMLEKIIKKMSFPKSMFWSDPNIQFARPVRWIVALFGNDVIDVEFAGIKSGKTSRGHRFMGAESVAVNSPAEYEAKMAENKVVIDPEKRSKMILEGIARVEKELGAAVEVDPALLEENVHLVEYPVVFYGSFDESFIEIPQEVLILSMAKNQRYFPVRSANGKLMPNFVGVSNNIAKDMGVVREGNERVLRARLHDAAFFWKEDLAVSLDSRTEELKSVTYQEQLGSVYEKVQRSKALALGLTEDLGHPELLKSVERAASLAKADLVTSMVYEFADVQGVMGREYAKKAGEPEDVCNALYEQYLPRFAGDAIPSGLVGAIIGIADRCDTLAAIYKIGLEPTSSQDPYGLRRAARCINEIIWGLSLDIDIVALLDEAAEALAVGDDRRAHLHDFIKQRLQVQLREKGVSHGVAALALDAISERPLQVLRMAQVLEKSAGEEWFTALVTSAVRVKNLLAKAGDTSTSVKKELFEAEAESALHSKLASLSEPLKEAFAACDWEKLSMLLSELSPAISEFFDDVLVMDENLDVRANRLALLGQCAEFFGHVGDFSLLK